jgi:hypothetical protein
LVAATVVFDSIFPTSVAARVNSVSKFPASAVVRTDFDFKFAVSAVAAGVSVPKFATPDRRDSKSETKKGVSAAAKAICVLTFVAAMTETAFFYQLSCRKLKRKGEFASLGRPFVLKTRSFYQLNRAAGADTGGIRSGSRSSGTAGRNRQ